MPTALTKPVILVMNRKNTTPPLFYLATTAALSAGFLRYLPRWPVLFFPKPVDKI